MILPLAGLSQTSSPLMGCPAGVHVSVLQLPLTEPTYVFCAASTRAAARGTAATAKNRAVLRFTIVEESASRTLIFPLLIVRQQPSYPMKCECERWYRVARTTSRKNREIRAGYSAVRVT